jgi:phospholipid N-methyltransferase
VEVIDLGMKKGRKNRYTQTSFWRWGFFAHNVFFIDPLFCMLPTFLKEFIANPRRVGSIWPTSGATIQRILNHVPSDSELVVELGAGVGTVTRPLLAHVASRTEVMAYELHTPFVTELEAIDDNRLTVVGASAETMSNDIMAGHVDVVVSVLPISLLTPKVRTSILKAVQQVLKPGGKYLQIQYWSPLHKQEIEQYFADTLVEYSWFNIPPTCLYVCTNSIHAVVEKRWDRKIPVPPEYIINPQRKPWILSESGNSEW